MLRVPFVYSMKLPNVSFYHLTKDITLKDALKGRIIDVKGNEFDLIHDALVDNFALIFEAKCSKCSRKEQIKENRFILR